MSLLHSPRIVTDNIVFNLDAANLRSLSDVNPNLLPFSEDYSNVTWDKTASGTGVVPTVVPNFALAPDGTLTADLVSFNSGGSGNSNVSSGGDNRNPLVGTTRTFSFYARTLSVATPLTMYNAEDIQNITVTTDWQRFSYTRTMTTSAGFGVRFAKREIWGTGGSADILIWGAQWEESFTASEYRPVNGSSRSQTWSDVINNNIQGTLVNGPTYGSTNLGFLNFNFNNNQRVTFPFNEKLLFLNRDPYTLEAWVYPTRNPGSGNFTGIFDRESSATGSRDGFNFFFLGSAGTDTGWYTERFAAGVQSGPGGYTINQSLSVNRWQHVVATYDGTNVRFYYNGSLISQGASTGNISNSVAPFTIASRGGQPFDGRISVARVYSKALTDTEVSMNFNAMRTRYGL
jgi:hypothetical protein